MDEADMDEKDKLIESYRLAANHNKLWLVYNLGMDEGKPFWNPMCAYHDKAFAQLKRDQMQERSKATNTEESYAQWMIQEVALRPD